MRLSDVITFQKALALAASASNSFEAEAAELAVRRIMESRNIDPTRVPDRSFVSRHIDFTDNALLQKLREQYRAAHPLPEKKKVAEEPVEVEIPVVAKIPWNIKGYRRVAAKNQRKNNKKKRRAYPRRDTERVEKLRQLLNSGLSWTDVANQGEFTMGQVSGIVRDMTATMGARQNNPRWIKEQRNGMPYYRLVDESPDAACAP